MEGMIGLRHPMQRRRRPEVFDDGFEQLHVSQIIAGALHKQHRNMDIGQMFRPIGRRLARRMQRKAQEGQSMDAGQRLKRLRL